MMNSKITSIILFIGIVIFGQTEEEMKAWQAYMTPSETHQFLAKYDGEWSSDVTMWMMPNTDPVKSNGIMNSKMIFEGKYQESEYSGNYAGMPMKGKSYIAFDNATETFISTWIDNFGTGMMVLKGKWESPFKTIRMEGEMVDPMSGKSLPVVEIFTFLDENTQLMEMYMEVEGEKFKSMEIKYKRKN